MSQRDDQRQQQLRDAYERRQQQIGTAAERILAERGPDLERQALIRDLDVIPDPERHKEAAAEMARELAERGVRSGNFNFSDYRDVPDLGIERAEKARADREQEQDAAQEAAPEPDSPPQASGRRIDELEKPQLPNYASLRQEHAQAVAGQADERGAEQGHKKLEFAEDRQPERTPDHEQERAETREQSDERTKKLSFFEDRNPAHAHDMEH